MHYHNLSQHVSWRQTHLNCDRISRSLQQKVAVNNVDVFIAIVDLLERVEKDTLEFKGKLTKEVVKNMGPYFTETSILFIVASRECSFTKDKT